MNRLFTLLAIFAFVFSFAQQSANRFDNESESAFTKNAIEKEIPKSDDPKLTGKPGNPGEPVPIDHYLPLLAITAVGIIIYTTQKKRNLIRK